MTHPIQTNYLSAIVDSAKLADQMATTQWLSDYRRTQIDALASAEFPHAKVEHFKYSRLDAFSAHKFNTLAPVTNETLDIDSHDIAGLDTNQLERVVFINGHFSPEHSQLGTHHITAFADANSEQRAKINAQLCAQSPLSHNPFSLVCASLLDNGVLIEIDENSPQSLIEVLNIVDGKISETTVASHLVIDVAERAKGTVISRSLNWDLSGKVTNIATQQTLVTVGDNAHFTHYGLQLDNAQSVVFANSDYHLSSHATLKAFYAATGSTLKKLDVTVNHNGQHAHAFLDGLYAATNDQQVDYHTTINHPLANGQTDEIFRGIVNGNAEATFNGRIHIFEDAQKTRAELSNKNLVLSDTAQIHTKPELEIYADDVVCAHGATVSRMNDESLNYLRARGIGKDEAELMLSYGFFNEVLEELEHKAIADYLRPILFARFE